MQFEPYPHQIYMNFITPARTFAAVAFFIGELGDGLNYFQAMYLLGLDWNESAIGLALSLMGFTTLFMQTCAGEIVDRATIDRRLLLSLAALTTAGSAMAIMCVREGNQDHMLMYVTKILEGIACSFMAPCLTALTLANFGPEHFDTIMASNVFWGLVGYAISATLVGVTAYIFYPNIKLCFLVIGFSAIIASVLTRFLPEGHPKLGSGFRVDNGRNEDIETSGHVKDENTSLFSRKDYEAASYWSVFTERRTLVFCLTGFFFQ
jgi:MFS family permease